MNERRDSIPWDVESDESPVPIAEVTDVLQREETTYLVLRVNIEGQGQTLLLSEDALANCGLPGLEVATNLRKIRETLSRIEGAVPLSDEIAVSLFSMIEANYRLPKKEGTG